MRRESNLSGDSKKSLIGCLAGLKEWRKNHGIGYVLARGASGSLLVMAIGSVIALLSNVILARVMGVTQYGIYVYVLACVNVLALVCRIGFPNSLLKFVPAYVVNSEWSLLRGIIGSSFKYASIISVSVAIMSAVVVMAISDRIDHDHLVTFWIGLLFLPLITLTELRQAGLQSFKRVVLAEIPNSVLRPAIITTIVVFFYLYTHRELLAREVMLINLMATVFAVYLGTVWMLKALPLQMRQVKSEYDYKEWVRVAIPQFLMSAITPILRQTDIVMIGMILSPGEAGVYAVSSRLAGFAIFGLAAANMIVVPLISELHSSKRHEELQRMITISARGIFVFAMMVVAVLALFGEFLLSFFGKEFVVGYLPLVLLLVGQLFSTLAGSSGFLMTMTGHQNQAAKILGVCAVVNIILNAVLISSIGIIGAALATATTTILMNGAMMLYVWRRMKINPTVFARLI